MSEQAKLQWLNSICGEAQRGIGHPWTVDRGGEEWTIATDGKTLVATRGNHGFPLSDKSTPNFESVLRRPNTPRLALLLSELRSLALPWIATNLPTCDACDNTGLIECEECDGEGFEECECVCGHEHEADCDACGGRGSTPCAVCPSGAKEARESRPVWIGDALFDLCLFAVPLANIEGDVATFQQEAFNRAAFLDIGEWLVLIMPLNRDMATGEKYTTAPRLAFAEPASSVTPSEGQDPGVSPEERT